MQDKKEMQDKMEEREALIDEVIKREWEQFQYVQNEGGRASCQDDHETFVIMPEESVYELDAGTAGEL